MKQNLKNRFNKNNVIIMGTMLLSAAYMIYANKKNQKKLREMAFIDDITGLWNGNKFKIEANEIVLKKRNKDYALVYMDIDKFKYINDTFGFKNGDILLKLIANMLLKSIKEKEMFARLSADNFIMLLDYETRNKFNQRINSLIKVLNKIKRKDGEYYKLNFKLGIYVIKSDEHNLDISKLIDRANIARKSIKHIHECTFAYYDEALKRNLANEIEIENIMEGALYNKQFKVYFQPKYNLETESIIGAEALVRWEHPKKGIIQPIKFIPLFEKNGFIVNLDFYVYEEVFKKMRYWLDNNKNIVPVSVNVSRVHLSTSDFVNEFIKLVKKYNIPPYLIELELTEGIFINDYNNMLNIMKILKKSGFSLSIDDFGSGYSSLNLLKNMPVDILKIDKEFLNESKDSKRSSIIIEQVVEMAKKLNIIVICEGVETRNQAEFLKSIGCNTVQGYLFSKPVTIEEYEKMSLK